MKLIPFAFENTAVRVADKDGEPWFVAKDVCAALTKHWNGQSLDQIPDGWKGMTKLVIPGAGEQEIVIINEAAVYKLAFRSNKPEAERFTNWVASDVLPTIRKTGSYGVTDELAEKIDRIYGIDRMLSHKVTELEKLARHIESLRADDTINSDSRRSAVTHASALTLLIEAGAVQKRRNHLVRKLSRALCDLDRDETKRHRCLTTRTWLFERSFAKDFMRHVGNAWVSDHNAHQAGQGVLLWPKTARSTK